MMQISKGIIKGTKTYITVVLGFFWFIPLLLIGILFGDKTKQMLKRGLLLESKSKTESQEN